MKYLARCTPVNSCWGHELSPSVSPLRVVVKPAASSLQLILVSGALVDEVTPSLNRFLERLRFGGESASGMSAPNCLAQDAKDEDTSSGILQRGG
jgi:hypothetical protein